MTRLSAAFSASATISILLLAATAAAQTPTESSEQPGAPVAEPAAAATPMTAPAPMSKVRIVRLSEVKGDVQLDRVADRGFEKAIANLPIIEKSRIQTGTGVAEIEFEDNSTMRVAPDSLVEFPRLERMPGGTTVSSVRLVRGMAYVSLMKSAGNEFDLSFGQENLRLPGGSHVRLELNSSEAKLAVLDGSVHIEGPMGVTDVPKKKTVTFKMPDNGEPTVTREIASNAFDSWDHSEAEYHERFAMMNSLSGSPYSYGMSDMAYYGAFSNYSGCGMMWRPYFASAGWDPYSNGAWAYYSGAGYSWVSPYPWGWMPYHYGAWSYCDGAGWGWMPGGDWMGLNNMAALTPRGTTPIRSPGPLRPRAGEKGLIEVNLKPLVRSQVTSAESFEFRKDSAGLGVPRNELGKLEKFSQHAVEKGMARTSVYFDAATMADSRGRVTASSFSMATMHRGSAPPAEQESFGSVAGGRSGGTSTSSASTVSSSRASAPSSSSGSHH